MANKSFSRRNFLASMASTAAAVSLPQTASAFMPGRSVPVNGPDRQGRNAGPVKILGTQNLSPKHVEQIRAAGKNINLIMIADTTRQILTGIAIGFLLKSFFFKKGKR